MKKFINSTAFGLAVSSVCYIFWPKTYTIFISFFCAIAFVQIGEICEKKLRNNGSELVSKIYFIFSKNKKGYYFNRLECIYSCLDDNKYSFEKKTNIKICKNNLDGYEEMFRWSAPSLGAKIEPIITGQKIKGIGQQEGWTTYQVKFDHIYEKGETVYSGSIVSNLIDNNKVALPFVSYTIREKMRMLILSVEFSDGNRPKGDVVFNCKNADGNTVMEEILQYNKKDERYSKSIMYPKKGYKYTIDWGE